MESFKIRLLINQDEDLLFSRGKDLSSSCESIEATITGRAVADLFSIISKFSSVFRLTVQTSR